MFEQAIDLIGTPLNQPKMQDFLTERGFIRRAVWHSSIRRQCAADGLATGIWLASFGNDYYA